MALVEVYGVGKQIGPYKYESVDVDVAYFAEFMRGPDDLCALCHGTSDNWQPHWETCPVCEGRPS